MKYLKDKLEELAQCLTETITTYEESRKFICANFAPQDYMKFCMELDRIREMNATIKEGINKWFDGVTIELKLMLEDICKYCKT